MLRAANSVELRRHRKRRSGHFPQWRLLESQQLSQPRRINLGHTLTQHIDAFVHHQDVVLQRGNFIQPIPNGGSERRNLADDPIEARCQGFRKGAVAAIGTQFLGFVRESVQLPQLHFEIDRASFDVLVDRRHRVCNRIEFACCILERQIRQIGDLRQVFDERLKCASYFSAAASNALCCCCRDHPASRFTRISLIRSSASRPLA
jgi:hypothetical protein